MNKDVIVYADLHGIRHPFEEQSEYTGEGRERKRQP